MTIEEKIKQVNKWLKDHKLIISYYKEIINLWNKCLESWKIDPTYKWSGKEQKLINDLYVHIKINIDTSKITNTELTH